MKQFQVKSWQLIPHDQHKWVSRKIQVGDTVQVISPLSLEYQKKGKVCSMADSGVEVIEHRTNTMVC